MDTTNLKKFAQNARRSLIEQVASKLTFVLAENSAARRQYPNAVAQLEKEIGTFTKERVIDKVAYTWFNRFCALRFMDANRYTKIGVVSAAVGRSQPEILAEAKMGHVDDKMVSAKTQSEIAALLSGETHSPDPQGEAYRLLLVAVCNYYHRAMPYLFERIADYVELLIPDDLLSPESILAATREAMTPEACQNVEVIGWLYQFYISEKKDKVFAGLKKKQKITTENIPAATQLFTPHWIVRYLVENSLGRLWMLNHPGSKLADKMEYYIPPEEVETEFLQVKTPEEIKICDPACGSGHMLVYAFDLLYAIYEEEGYEPSEIPEKILTQNLYGVEIDERAGELAAFALTMKAREKYRRFLRKPVQPNICVLQPIEFTEDELSDYMDFVGHDLFTVPLLETLNQFKEADNFGSLIQPVLTDVEHMLKHLEQKNPGENLFLNDIHQKVLQVLKQADYLSPKYHVVVANPPYMGGKGMNPNLTKWAKTNYSDSKSDLFAMFIERIRNMVQVKGFIGLMTPFTWMFLSSYEELRSRILNESTITSLVRPEYHAFFDSAYVPICAFTLWQNPIPNYKGVFIDLRQFYGANLQPVKVLEAIKNPDCDWYYLASAVDFKKIPGKPLHYDISETIRNIFIKFTNINSIGGFKRGISTADNDRFLRFCWEISIQSKDVKWIPYNKGGEWRKWYGNQEYFINWENNGKEICNFDRSYVRNIQHNFKPNVAYSSLTSSKPSFRFYTGHINDQSGNFLPFESLDKAIKFTSLLNSKTALYFANLLSPTLNILIEELNKLPILDNFVKFELASSCIEEEKSDWDSYETSWNFAVLPLLKIDYHQPILEVTYNKLNQYWQEKISRMQRLEEENNRIFIEAYGLQDELTPDVPLHEITLTCNPYYRYDHTKPEAELEALLLADTMKEYISYAVGCMFGRYSLDKPGLILANQGETIEDYYQQVPEPTFTPDEDNVIPILDGDWFADDICDRFRQFLRVTFGEEHYEENLQFIEQAIGKDIRKYFLKDFYNDHVKRYKKRPIYWLFSSPKGSFNALIYLHRYRPDTVSVVLNDYLREFQIKLKSRVENLRQIEVSAEVSQSEKTKAIKEITKLNKTIEELKDYERDVLYPLAIQQVQLDLDDGVKTNYPKLGAALKKVTGLEAKQK
ncbi:BREX-1 system adenine-specific DNA-methyltransferase PglX [Myxosarcina sp. GI1]|uniref:BREX-1 system adenine-specific DNA-methyltransferase PglX n=1 Tax=Myxosarcina sp. GI1 TaxID=1541065 RepID=UPI000563875C|nr:BREX-1 system adenine-specific DNA-methyltransferase PglX [Myxosarcina sp. GI1]